MGVDVFAQRAGHTVAIQCKRYGAMTKVGRPDIQRLVGVRVQIQATSAICVTTSTYTKAAQEAAKATDIELIDGERLVALVQESGLYPRNG